MQESTSQSLDESPEMQREREGYDGEVQLSTVERVTVEYDVVKCEDFVSDPGRWVRNMPEEIRRVNPAFVPT